MSDVDKQNPLHPLTVCIMVLNHERNEQSNLPSISMNYEEKLLNFLFQGNRLPVYIYFVGLK
jgi:hypothetical protein